MGFHHDFDYQEIALFDYALSKVLLATIITSGVSTVVPTVISCGSGALLHLLEQSRAATGHSRHIISSFNEFFTMILITKK